jgi:hypothetical protein
VVRVEWDGEADGSVTYGSVRDAEEE